MEQLINIEQQAFDHRRPGRGRRRPIWPGKGDSLKWTKYDARQEKKLKEKML